MKKLALLAVIALAVIAFWFHWNWKRPLPPSGGLYFFQRVELSVPQFRQADARWRDERLGPTDGTLGAEGCAITSVAMILNYYGVETDPSRLNKFLTNRGGYTERGWLYWEKAAEFMPYRVEHVYEDLPSYRLIDSNLRARNPVIVRLRFPSGITHFVAIVGKDGFDYLIRDPGAGSAKGVHPLREFGSKIEALRFYRRIAPSRER